MEYTVGPIPTDTPWIPKPKGVSGEWGKEVVIRYNSGLQSKGTFYTDSNGLAMQKRILNYRPSFNFTVFGGGVNSTANYYPVGQAIAIQDEET